MSKQNWRKDLDGIIDHNLSEIIKETKKSNSAIIKSKDKSKAQIWVAIALLNQKINDLKFEKKEYEKKLPEEELTKILKTLEKL
jgi:CYTH domain-containing protein